MKARIGASVPPSILLGRTKRLRSCLMRHSCVWQCLSKLQLYALERRKTVASYKYLSDPTGIKASFKRLSPSDIASLERKVDALRNDVAARALIESDEASAVEFDGEQNLSGSQVAS
uniref:Uncharacterized protein n=1 Tax=Trypanosoma congolense (strain IL3000) TaxID=1068625 RepID=G0UM31_TRYCI|nr:hypothetical protein, unlikely [Trypanosoma congolense IL3000]